jgi:hypothetical protein
LSHLTLCPPLIPPDFSNLELLATVYTQVECKLEKGKNH